LLNSRILDEIVREQLGVLLVDRGYVDAGRSIFVRIDESGHDCVALDPSPKKARFRVMIGHVPAYIYEYAHEYHGMGRADCGTPQQSPYLNPGGVSSKPCFWPYNTKEHLVRSLVSVQQAYLAAGEKRLTDLRDPATYAAEADPEALIPTALAWEAAGNVERATHYFTEMRDRYLRIHAEFEGLPTHPETWREFLFVMHKLGESTPLTCQIEELQASRTPSPAA